MTMAVSSKTVYRNSFSFFQLVIFPTTQATLLVFWCVCASLLYFPTFFDNKKWNQSNWNKCRLGDNINRKTEWHWKYSKDNLKKLLFFVCYLCLRLSIARTLVHEDWLILMSQTSATISLHKTPPLLVYSVLKSYSPNVRKVLALLISWSVSKRSNRLNSKVHRW